MTIFSALRACFSLRRFSSACTTSSKDRTCSGSDRPKLLRWHSTINSGRGSFHGSCPPPASDPSFRGFIPTSRAICVCAWLNLKRLLASNQGFSFVGIRVIHRLSGVITVSPPVAQLMARRRGVERKAESLQEVTKEVVGIHVPLTRSLFACDILRRSLLHASLAKSPSAPLRF